MRATSSPYLVALQWFALLLAALIAQITKRRNLPRMRSIGRRLLMWAEQGVALNLQRRNPERKL
jgi:hypothetical protein